MLWLPGKSSSEPEGGQLPDGTVLQHLRAGEWQGETHELLRCLAQRFSVANAGILRCKSLSNIQSGQYQAGPDGFSRLMQHMQSMIVLKLALIPGNA